MNEIRDISNELIPVAAVEIGEDGNVFYTANVLRRKFREKYPEGRIFVGLPKRVNPDPAAVEHRGVIIERLNVSRVIRCGQHRRHRADYLAGSRA